MTSLKPDKIIIIIDDYKFDVTEFAKDHPGGSKILQKYHNNIIYYFENPRNIGSFNKGEPNVFTGLVGAPACGDVMKIELKIEDDIVTDCKHKVFGCGSAIASSSYATEWIKNKKVEEVEKMTNKDIAKYLNLPPVKLHCSMLAEDAIKNAIQKYKIVQMKKKKSQEKPWLNRAP